MALPRKPLTVRRYSAGTYVSGRWVEGGETDFDLTASVHEVSGDELVSVPENRRTENIRKIITGTDLRTADEAGGTNADRVLIGGLWYEVVRVKHWLNGLLPHRIAYVAEVK